MNMSIKVGGIKGYRSAVKKESASIIQSDTRDTEERKKEREKASCQGHE